VPHIDLVTDIAAEPEVCFDVSVDVGVHVAASPTERIVGGVRSGRMRLGEHVTWSARHFGIRWRMTSKVVAYERPHMFVDEMQRGPFGRWRHQHILEETGYGTRMIDHVGFASPFGLLGRIVDALVLERYMTRLLREHNDHVRAVAEGIAPSAQDSAHIANRLGRSAVHVTGTGTTTIRCEPSAVVDFVLDVSRYKQADHKIGRLHYLRRDATHGRVRHGGRFLGLPAPAATLDFELTSPSRLDFRGVRMPWPLRGFHGSFTCVPTPDGSQVTHSECFIFGPVSGRVFRALFGRWLARDTQAEVSRMKRLLEHEIGYRPVISALTGSYDQDQPAAMSSSVASRGASVERLLTDTSKMI
jgi:ligand-binding SRPBCC domain-containing protein